MGLAAVGRFTDKARDSGRASPIARADGGTLKGEFTGTVGKTYATKWFNFSVSSITRTDRYAGYAADYGNVLLDVIVSELCTFDDAIDMGTSDYYLDAESFDDYVYPMAPLDGTMMPERFELAPDETVEYHMVFEIPSGAVGVTLVYNEIDEEEYQSASFCLDVPD
jgi:hypothetical protein